MLKRGAVLACVAGLALVAPAGAATVHGYDFYGVSYSALVYNAAPGEANRVTVSTQGDNVRLDDAGALITSSDQPDGTYCLAAVRTALCHHRDGSAGFALFVTLGDGDDSITTASSAVLDSEIDGGPGNDRLAGGGSYHGGPGADDMHGPDASASYNDASGPVTISLDDKPNDGVSGEGDNVHSDMDGAGGSPFDDRLTAGPNGSHLGGGSGNDRISGGAGADTLSGGLGNDVLVGGPGKDTLWGDWGDDVIYARDGQPDFVSCGDGNDYLVADPEDTVWADCENRA